MSQHKRARKERRRESRSIQRELVKSGAMARIEAVHRVLSEPVFKARLSDAIAWAEVTLSVRSLDQVRDLALGVLTGMGVDINGVNLKMFWTPPNDLRMRPVLEIGVAEAAIAAAKAKDERAPA